MELECTYMKIPHNNNICISLSGMRGCVFLDGQGKQLKICEFLKIKDVNK